MWRVFLCFFLTNKDCADVYNTVNAKKFFFGHSEGETYCQKTKLFYLNFKNSVRYPKKS